MSQKTALVPITNGNEEIEAVTSIDILVRAGVKVTIASVKTNGDFVTCSRGIKLIPDIKLEDVNDPESFDALVIPGGLGNGGGAKTLASTPEVVSLAQSYYKAGKIVGMICAGPLVAKAAKINFGKALTSHPSVKGEFSDYDYKEERVVVSDNLITSRGPGTSFLFALTLVEHIVGKEKRDEIEPPMVLAAAL